MRVRKSAIHFCARSTICALTLARSVVTTGVTVVATGGAMVVASGGAMVVASGGTMVVASGGAMVVASGVTVAMVPARRSSWSSGRRLRGG